MAETSFAPERLVREYAENYMEKVFYFCLKKTGDSYEAEDLTSDITLNILSALKGGTVPVHFSGWVWQIARNRYSAWAKAKHKLSESVTGSDIGEYEIADDDPDMLDRLIRDEELASLRRELAFISSDYRNLIVAYYVENRSTKEIAAALNLAQSTVTSKLTRARKILKEGMSMAREFGKMSYCPENMGFIMNGMSGEHGEPWSLISRSLCKNILLAAYRNPSTAEELAVEIGVALPYMEEELESLVNATLLKKNGNRYETAIFIVSAEAQEKIDAHLQGITPELTRVIIEAEKFQRSWLDENSPGWHEGYQPIEDMKWARLMKVTDQVGWDTYDLFDKTNYERTIRPNGGQWDLLGLEAYDWNRPAFVGLHGCFPSAKSQEEMGLEFQDFGQYKFRLHNLASLTPEHLKIPEVNALASVTKGSEADAPKALLKRLEKYGYIRKTESGYTPTLCVMFSEKKKPMPPEVKEEYNTLIRKAADIAARHYRFCRDQICKEIPDFLKDDEIQIDHACKTIFSLRGAVLEEALRTGYITYTESETNKMLGAYLMI